MSFDFVLELSYAGNFPGVPDRIHGRFSQNSSLMISTWSTTTCAFRRSLRILSCCDLDCLDSTTGDSSPKDDFVGFDSSSSYCRKILERARPKEPQYID